MDICLFSGAFAIRMTEKVNAGANLLNTRQPIMIIK